MHERGGLQGLVGRFIRHARRRQFAQFAIDQRQQFIGGLGIAVFDGFKNAGNVAQPATITLFYKVAPENWASAQSTIARYLFQCMSRKNICGPLMALV